MSQLIGGKQFHVI